MDLCHTACEAGSHTAVVMGPIVGGNCGPLSCVMADQAEDAVVLVQQRTGADYALPSDTRHIIY